LAARDRKILPESRLYGVMWGSAFLPVGLFIYSFTQYGYLPWIAPTIALAPIAIGIFFTHSVVLLLSSRRSSSIMSEASMQVLFWHSQGLCWLSFHLWCSSLVISLESGRSWRIHNWEVTSRKIRRDCMLLLLFELVRYSGGDEAYIKVISDIFCMLILESRFKSSMFL
jgi:hypothetical protein